MSNNFIKFITKVCPLILVASKRLRGMCFGYRSTPEKLFTNAKISCPPFNIHKSKLVVAKWHFAKASKTYNCLVFALNWAIFHEKFVS